MASVKRDYYEVLGVGRDASEDELRRAFRRLARQHHPDVNREVGAEERFKELNEAYEVLSDPEKRQRYDAFGHAGLEGVGVGADFGATFGPFVDLFESFFGADLRRGRARGATRGSDLRMELEIDFLDAVLGTERKVRVPRDETCSRCGGSGGEPGSETSTCRTCGGSGEVRTMQNSFFGRIVNVGTCPACGGRGRLIERPCATCGGAGREHVTRELTVTIPAGVDDGQQFRLTGEGEAGTGGGPAGNLYVLVRVRPHPVFERRGQDVIYELRLSPALAALGGTVEVPTVDGPQSIDVPAGTQHGALLRLRGKGLPRVGGGGRGDEIVVTTLVIPSKISGKERAAWEQLREQTKEPQRSHEERKFLDRLKDVLRGRA